MNKFSWGNLKSLTYDKDPEKLWEDLKEFYINQYSADRMKLVV